MIAGLLVVLLVFAMGGLLFIVFLSAQGIEERRMEDERRAQQSVRPARHVPQFLVITQPAAPDIGGLNEAFLQQFREYVDAEQTLASEFVLHPSMETLYRESGRRLAGH